MYKLNVISNFSSAHRLENYEGECCNLHGHNWKVRAAIVCDRTDHIGLTIDFGIVKKELARILSRLDHKYLNDLDIFKSFNPTSENIARFIYTELKKSIRVEGCQVSEVEIWESEFTSMLYFE